MKLYMQKDAFSWGTKLPLTDKTGRTRYFLTGDAFSLGKRLHVTDLAGQEAISVRQKVPSLFPRYELEVYGKPAAEIVKDLSFVRPRYVIEGPGWEIVGTIGACDYEITRNQTVTASSHSQKTPSGEVLELDLCDRDTSLTALGLILTVNCIFAPQEPQHL